MALFFMKSTAAHNLKDAPGGEAYLSHDPRVLARGGQVFAENCARCHSSKLPTPTKPMRLFSETGCSGPDYLTCWKEYWIWTKTEEFKSQIRTKVAAPDFLNDNFLSAEFRVPVTLLQSNACSPLASNAIRDNIWDNFSSETYKQLPSVGTITVYDPITGDPKPYAMPAGGRGYTRPASLISLWSTAPFLLNNSVGRLNPGAPDDTYNPSPTVANRMAAFQDAIEKMLWPEKRDRDPALGNKVPGVIDRTTQLSYVRVAPGYFPAGLERWGKRLFPRLFDNDDEFQIGPFPRGTPVGLLASLMIQPEEMGFWDRLRHDRALAALILELKRRLDALGPQRPGEGDDDYNRRATLVLTEKGSRGTEPSLASQLMALSKCPDYVVNRGHYFGTGYDGEAPLSDADKRALIEFLKTF
jgi:hypothetical protein